MLTEFTFFEKFAFFDNCQKLKESHQLTRFSPLLNSSKAVCTNLYYLSSVSFINLNQLL